jgi:transposase-like protein
MPSSVTITMTTVPGVTAHSVTRSASASRPACAARRKNGDRCRKRARVGHHTCQAHSEHPQGRPTKFTQEVRERILDALRTGVWVSTAAEYAGVSYETVRTWLRRGEAELAAGKQSEFTDFSVVVAQAIATTEVRALGLIQSAASKHWQAAAWWAEHALPQKYGRREQRAHVHAAAVGVELLLGGRDPADVPIEARERIDAILEEEGRATG